MNPETQKELIELKERLLEIELEQKNGAKYHSLEELDQALSEITGHNYINQQK